MDVNEPKNAFSCVSYFDILPHKVSGFYVGYNAKAASVINFLRLEIPVTYAKQVRDVRRCFLFVSIKRGFVFT